MFSGPDLGNYFEGLDAFAQSRGAALAPAERLAWLAQAIPLLPGTGIVYALTIDDARRGDSPAP